MTLIGMVNNGFSLNVLILEDMVEMDVHLFES